MKYVLFFIILICQTVQAKSLSQTIFESLTHYCQGGKSQSLLDKKIHYLKPSVKRCRHLSNLKRGQRRQLIQNQKLKANSLVHLHLPQLKVIEEEDDFLNDDLYMWFVITIDGIPYTKITKIYKELDEGQVLLFDAEDRVINNLQFKRNAIIDWGIVESDGDDISEMQRLSRHALELVTLALNQLDEPTRASRIELLKDQTAKVLTLLLGLDHDDRLTSGTLILDSSTTHHVWQNAGFYEFSQDYMGEHLNSHWHYQLLWRFLMVDINPSRLF